MFGVWDDEQPVWSVDGPATQGKERRPELRRGWGEGKEGGEGEGQGWRS